MKTLTPAKILTTWLRQEKKTKAQFTREMGYRSNQGYLLLTSRRPVTFETVGRLLVVYGADGPAAQIAEAMRRGGAR